MASYATPADLQQFAINPTAFASIPTPTIQAQLDAASTMAEGYLADQYHLPIVAPFPVDLRMHVSNIAAFYLLSFRGFKPDGSDMVVRLRYDDALTWLKNIASGTVSPAGIIDSSPGTREGAPAVVTGITANVVGGYATPTTTLPGQTKPYPYTGTVPGKRGW